MKTRREWLECLSSETREKAIANSLTQEPTLHEIKMEAKSMSLCASMAGFFCFGHTPEGSEFWWEVAEGKRK